MKIEVDTVGRKMLVDGVDSGLHLQVNRDEHGQTVWLGTEVEARVYRDGVLIADTTVPPLTKGLS
jgi:hypothetical protein